MNTALLLIHCPYDKGVVLSITDFIFKNKGNIVDLDQHVDGERKIFFMRIEWSISDFCIPKDKIGEYFDALVGHKHQMRWELHYRTEKPKMALMVSKMDHCFNDILSRYKSGEWNVEIPLIISNHKDMEEARPNAFTFFYNSQSHRFFVFLPKFLNCGKDRKYRTW